MLKTVCALCVVVRTVVVSHMCVWVGGWWCVWVGGGVGVWVRGGVGGCVWVGGWVPYSGFVIVTV